eukprot:GHVN01017208.1.p2 GENE.GHVN01017208.1~~GHVN01017208.1.p2  ORF type:complete len:104 (-),score=2.89 GHVN01017208.1:547-858(-)
MGGVARQNGRILWLDQRPLTATEANYTPWERELSAALWALHETRNLLRTGETTVETDNFALAHLREDQGGGTPRLTRLMGRLNTLGARLIFVPGRHNDITLLT